MCRSYVLYRMVSSIILFLVASLAGCSSDDEHASDLPITDAAYLTDDRWNDGQAEMAFYRVDRTENAYGESDEQEFLVGTYLVKHRFDRAAMAKAGDNPEQPVSSFKYALFYELDHGSYQRKRSFVVNARQRDLRPLKHSYTSFDWCSNLYRELAFREGEVQWLMRSDDYGNERERFSHRPHAFPIAELPMLVRGLDFSETAQHTFVVVHGNGIYTPAGAELVGRDSVQTSAGSFETDQIVVRYEKSVPSVIGEETASQEVYWRSTEPARHLVKLSAGSDRYTMELVELLRSPYWEENIYDHLQRVQERP